MSTEQLISKYLTEGLNVEQAKKEIKELQKSKKMGKLTKMGERRLEKLEDYLFSQGIFDF